MSLRYEPALELLHIYVKKLLSNDVSPYFRRDVVGAWALRAPKGARLRGVQSRLCGRLIALPSQVPLEPRHPQMLL
jgi:hypothetical protein